MCSLAFKGCSTRYSEHIEWETADDWITILFILNHFWISKKEFKSEMSYKLLRWEFNCYPFAFKHYIAMISIMQLYTFGFIFLYLQMKRNVGFWYKRLIHLLYMSNSNSTTMNITMNTIFVKQLRRVHLLSKFYNLLLSAHPIILWYYSIIFLGALNL